MRAIEFLCGVLAATLLVVFIVLVGLLGAAGAAALATGLGL